MKVLVLPFFIFSLNVYSWECPLDDGRYTQENKIEYFWVNRPNIIVGTVVSGKKFGKGLGRFDIEVSVNKSYKSKLGGVVHYNGDWSAGLTLGQEYIFFTNGRVISYCDLVLPYSESWATRKDLPIKSSYVNKIIRLSGSK